MSGPKEWVQSMEDGSGPVPSVGSEGFGWAQDSVGIRTLVLPLPPRLHDTCPRATQPYATLRNPLASRPTAQVEARAAFRAALYYDPYCAMCWWGLAYSRGRLGEGRDAGGGGWLRGGLVSLLQTRWGRGCRQRQSWNGTDRTEGP